MSLKIDDFKAIHNSKHTNSSLAVIEPEKQKPGPTGKKSMWEKRFFFGGGEILFIFHYQCQLLATIKSASLLYPC